MVKVKFTSRIVRQLNIFHFDNLIDFFVIIAIGAQAYLSAEKYELAVKDCD